MDENEQRCDEYIKPRTKSRIADGFELLRDDDLDETDFLYEGFSQDDLIVSGMHIVDLSEGLEVPEMMQDLRTDMAIYPLEDFY